MVLKCGSKTGYARTKDHIIAGFKGIFKIVNAPLFPAFPRYSFFSENERIFMVDSVMRIWRRGRPQGWVISILILKGSSVPIISVFSFVSHAPFFRGDLSRRNNGLYGFSPAGPWTVRASRWRFDPEFQALKVAASARRIGKKQGPQPMP